MPRQVQPWFRMYVETFADRKIRRLTPAQRWVWAAVLGAAKESPVPGSLLITEGVPMTAGDLAAYADVPKREAVAALREMTTLGMVSQDDGLIRVCNFHRRQFLSDDVTARTRDYRNRTGMERSNDVPTNVPGNSRGNVPTDADGTVSSRAGGRAGRVNRGTTSEEEPGTTRGGKRNETLRASRDTEPTCSQHPFGDAAANCGGCRKVREWRDKAEADAREERERERSRGVLADLEAAKRERTAPPADWRKTAAKGASA